MPILIILSSSSHLNFPNISILEIVLWLVHFQVEYFDNKIICALVEQQHKGILAILDEACLNVGKVTDEVSR
jgi:hypothetical protein